jgi:hypothetical protein
MLNPTQPDFEPLKSSCSPNGDEELYRRSIQILKDDLSVDGDSMTTTNDIDSELGVVFAT